MKNKANNAWVVEFSEVQEKGLEKKLELTDKTILGQLSEDISVDEIYSLHLFGTITRFKTDGLSIKGAVNAEVRQSCVVTLEPVKSEISELFEVNYLPDAVIDDSFFDQPLDEAAIAKLLAEDDPPEPLIDNKINLIDIAREFLSLGVNPYPRKDGVNFKDPAADNVITPFDILKKLK